MNNLMAFCPYCGAKILFDVTQMNELIKAREDTKQAQIQAYKEIQIAMIKKEQEDQANQHQLEMEKQENALIMKLVLALFAVSGIFALMELLGFS